VGISFVCEECGKKLKAPENLAGKRIKCPACQTPATVPFPEATDDEVFGADWMNSDSAEDPDAVAERRAEKARKARMARQAAAEGRDPEEDEGEDADDNKGDEAEQALSQISSRPRKKKKVSSESAVESQSATRGNDQEDEQSFMKHDLPYVALLIGFGTYFWLFRLVAESRGT
jgi:hypothetical protein